MGKSKTFPADLTQNSSKTCFWCLSSYTRPTRKIIQKYIQLSDKIISLIVFAREHVVGFNSRQSRYQYVQRISHSRTKKETKQKNKNFSLKGITSVSVKFDHISNVKENGIKCRIGGKSVAENISVFTKPRSCNTTF